MILLATLFIPLLVAGIMILIPGAQGKTHRTLAAVGTAAAFLVSLVLWFQYDSTNAAFQFVIDYPWITSLDVGFRFGLDGMSLLLVLLTTFMMTIAVLSSWESVRDREKQYYIWMLILEFGMLGVFMALDTFLFYIFWELVLIPMYFLIGVWGGRDRIYASMKFFIYTMGGSLLMLVAIIWLGTYAEGSGGFTTDLQKLMSIAPNTALDAQKWLFLAFALSFCIKVPVFPLHTWLPDAHTQAPTAGSVILAGVMLKMGTYGLIRFNLQLFPQSSLHFADFISVLAVIGIIYGALLAMVQTDVKRLVAYSSVAHLGFVTLGIFSMTTEGVQGAVIQMVNHGLSTGMLFLLVGYIYDRRHTRQMSDFGGLARSMPVYATFFAIAVFASVGLPGLNGFVGEYLTLIGAFTSQHLSTTWFAILGATGVIFAAVYLLILFQRMFFGPITHPENEKGKIKDLSRLETGILVPIVIFIVWIGIQPNTFLHVSEASSRAVVGVVEELSGSTDYTAEVKERRSGQAIADEGSENRAVPTSGPMPEETEGESAPGAQVLAPPPVVQPEGGQ